MQAGSMQAGSMQAGPMQAGSMHQLSFKRHRFAPEVIRHSIWLYAGFTQSFRNVEEILAERGLDVSYETVRRRFLKFGSVIAARPSLVDNDP